MRVSISVKGEKEFRRALDQVRQAGEEAIEDFVDDIAIQTHARAVRGIQRGPASGKVYEKYNPRRTHQASAPGQYPMTDTGRLAASVQMELEGSGENRIARVGTAVRYGRHLEFGTSKMAARPWLLRSFEAEIRDAAKRLRAEFESKL